MTTTVESHPLKSLPLKSLADSNPIGLLFGAGALVFATVSLTYYVVVEVLRCAFPNKRKRKWKKRGASCQGGLGGETERRERRKQVKENRRVKKGEHGLIYAVGLSEGKGKRQHSAEVY